MNKSIATLTVFSLAFFSLCAIADEEFQILGEPQFVDVRVHTFSDGTNAVVVDDDWLGTIDTFFCDPSCDYTLTVGGNGGGSISISNGSGGTIAVTRRNKPGTSNPWDDTDNE